MLLKLHQQGYCYDKTAGVDKNCFRTVLDALEYLLGLSPNTFTMDTVLYVFLKHYIHVLGQVKMILENCHMSSKLHYG